MMLEEKLWKTFNKALGQYRLIDEDDHILVALSGGKDSLLLTEFMARRSRIHVPHFTVEALHVRMENIHYETDTAYLQSFCDHHGIPLHIITTRFAPTPDAAATVPDSSPAKATVPDASASGKQKPPCFLCSWQRRKVLFRYAQDHGFTKIALGHHQDDLIHTALMNLTFEGHFTTMPPRLQMRKMPLALIRPLCLCQESDISIYAQQQSYEKLKKLCPYEQDTHRTTARQLFNEMERLNPEARYSIWHALQSEGKTNAEY